MPMQNIEHVPASEATRRREAFSYGRGGMTKHFFPAANHN
jgi:hypothetical protein